MDNPGDLVPEGTFRHLLDFLVQNEDNTGRRTNNLDGLPPHPDQLVPPSLPSPPFLHRMPFLTQPSKFIPSWKLQDRIPSKGLREGIGLDDIISVLQQNRLRWYGHMLQKEDNDWVKKCMEYEVEGTRPRGRPKKTWREIVEQETQLKLAVADRTKPEVEIWRRPKKSTF